MSQHTINCPSCNTQHIVDVFRSGGIANAIISLDNKSCKFETSDRKEIIKLLGIEETHRQRIYWQEMPKEDY